MSRVGGRQSRLFPHRPVRYGWAGDDGRAVSRRRGQCRAVPEATTSARHGATAYVNIKQAKAGRIRVNQKPHQQGII